MKVWMATDDLVVGDLVLSADGRSTRRIVRFEPRFNPCFRPTVFADDPHTAVDLDRDADIRIVARAQWAAGASVSRITAPPLLTEVAAA